MFINYIINFKRINELTAHSGDVDISSPFITSYFSISKKIIKEYMEIYTEYGRNKKYLMKNIILHFNGILISEDDIRDGKIESILS